MRTKRRKKAYRPGLVEWFFITVAAVSLVLLAVTLLRYARDRRAYERAQALAVVTPAPTLAATPAPEATPTPVPLETPPIAVDFEAVRKEGEHVRGWLYSEGTLINYPVVYYSNNEYYLAHDYTGRRSDGGALFFDTAAGKALSGDNLLVYGHHMKDRSMFGSLLQYQKQDYYDAHPTMYLLTLDGNFRIDLISARYLDAEPQNYSLWFGSEAEKEAFVRSAVLNSDFTPADAAFRPDTRLISLVTCAYSNYMDDARYVVMGWLEPIGPEA